MVEPFGKRAGLMDDADEDERSRQRCHPLGHYAIDHIEHGPSSLLGVVNVGDEHNKHDNIYGFLQHKKPKTHSFLIKCL
jgi:hypothetical protein